MKITLIKVLTITLIGLTSAIFAQTQPQNWDTYPIDIQKKYLLDNLNYEVVSGNATVTVRDNNATDTLGFIDVSRTAGDTSKIVFTLPIENLPATQLFGGAIGISLMPTNSNNSAQLLGTLEYSTNGIDFHPSVPALLKYSDPTHYAGAFTYGYTIPQTTTKIRLTYINWGSETFRFQIGEYLSQYLPKKEQWYDFGEKSDFGFINQHYSGEGEDNVYFFETGGLSENFAARQIAKVPQTGWLSPKITDIEDVNGQGQMDIALCCRGTTSLGITRLYGGDMLKSQPDGSYDVIYGGVVVPNLDVNKDGRLDYLRSENDDRDQATNIIALQQANGLFSDAFVDRMTFDEYHNTEIVEEEEWVYSVNPNNIIQGKGLPSNAMWPVRGGVLESSAGGVVTGSDKRLATAIADLNKDGIPDMLAPNSGLVYYGLGNNTYVYSSLDGNVVSKDLNGDGVSDYIVYGGSNKAITAYVYEGEGQFKTPQVLMRNLAPDTEIYLYDFDKDDDIDILITFSSYLNNGTAYTLFAKNDGHGNFDVEDESLLISISDDYKFAACTDVDNDGFFDLFHIKYIASSVSEGTADIQVRRGKANFQFEEAETLFTMPYNRTIDNLYELWKLNVADIDRDSKYEVWLQEGFRVPGFSGREQITTGHLYRYNTTTANTPPEKPEKPNLLYNAGAGQLDINWKLGEDTENSAVDLTYALRVGTAPGLDDVFTSHAFADGVRKNFRNGNMGSELSHSFDVRSWKPGTYYVSVQTIDPMFQGSEFSDEATFEHTYLPNEFTVARTNQGSITAFDTLEVSYNQYPESDLVYNWDFAGAEVVDSTLGQFKLRYAQAGTKTISLSVTSDELTSDRFEIHLTVLPNKMTWDDSASATFNRSTVALENPLADYNMDGLLDVVLPRLYNSAQPSDGLYENTGNGRFTKSPAVWNSTLSPIDAQWLDIDNNGRLDMFYRQNDESQYLRHSNTTIGGFGNTGAVSLDEYRFINGTNEQTWTQILSWYSPYLMDLTNNGKFDVVRINTYRADAYYFNEGIANTTLRGVNTFTADHVQWLDFNKDGFMDFCGMESVYRNGKTVDDLRFYENLGTGSTTDGFATPEPFRRVPRLQRQNLPADLAWTVQDMNADGFYDFVYIEGNDQIGYKFFIEYNNQNQSFGTPQEILVDPNNGMLSSNLTFNIRVFDFDNNGYLDVLATIKDKKDGQIKPYIFYFDANGYMAQGFLYDGDVSDALRYVSAFADIDGDGIPDFYPGKARRALDEWGSSFNYPYLTKMQSTATNTKPQPPGNLVAQQTEQGLWIEWDPATDAETPFALMRYNLSVKKKGSNVTADAYIISPLNDGNTTMAVLPRYTDGQQEKAPAYHHYIEACKFFVPASVLSGEVEIKVQAIDQWDAQSEFTEPIFVKISDVVNLAMSSQACFDEPVTVTFTGTQSGTPVWDFDGGEVVNNATGFGPYEVKWNTPGIKTVRISLGTDTSELQTLVYEEMSGFSIPDSVFVGTEYKFTYPALLPRENEVAFRLMLRAQDQGRYPPNKMSVSAPIGGSEGTITFEDYSFYNPIRVQMIVRVANNICTKYFDEDIQLMPLPETPQIEYLAQTGGKIEVRWDSQFMDERIDTIVIYKEGMSYNQFNEIGRVPKSEHGFIDISSNLNIRSEAYNIRGILSASSAGSIITKAGTAHQSPRLTITKDNDGKNTLIWSQYIGTRIDNFTVLRGSTPETMNEIASLPGHRVFFVDDNPNPDESYYALQFEPIPSSEFRAPNHKIKAKSAKSSPNVQSNVVFAGDASQSILIDRMNILAVQKTVVLNGDQPSLFLYPEIFPSNATFQNVTWSIVSGDDKATINSNGVLSGLPGQSGTIRVRVEATDGSNAFAERNISISAFSTPCNVPANLYLEQLTDSTVSLMWNGTNDGYKLTYYDTLTKNIVFTKLVTETFYNLQHTDFPKSGTYAWSVRGICGTDTTTAVDGEMFTITVTESIEIVNAQTPTINGQPQSVSVNVGDNPNLTVTASVTDGGTLSYQWYSSTINTNSGGTPVGTNSNTYAPATTTAGTYYYYVEVTNTNTTVNGTQTATIASNAATVTVSAGSSIAETELDNTIKIFPNPITNGTLIVEIPETINSPSIEIYDFTGKLLVLRTVNRPKTEINISHLPDGTYIVKIGSITAKIIKQ